VKKLSGDASPSPPLEERVGERRPFSAANLNFFTASEPLQLQLQTPNFKLQRNFNFQTQKDHDGTNETHGTDGTSTRIALMQ